LNKNLFKL